MSQGLKPVEDTAWQVIRRAHLRLLCRLHDDDPAAMSADEQAAMLSPYYREMDLDLAVLRECLRQAYLEGVRSRLDRP